LIEASSSTVDVPSTAFPRRASVAYRLLSVLIAGVVLIATFAYAYAFSRLYTRPITRIEASRWIYANIPGPINLPIQTDQETFNQLIPFPNSLTISPGVPYLYAFQPRVAGTLSQVYLPHVSEVQGTHEVRTLTLSISSDQSEEPLATATLVDDLTPSEDPSGKGYTLALDKPVTLDSQKKYNLQLSMPGEATVVALGGVVTLVVQPATGIPSTEPLEIPLSTSGTVLYPNSPSSAVFTAPADGSLAALKLPVLLNQSIPSQPISLTLSLRASDETTEPLVSSLSIQQDPKSQGYLLVLQQPQMLVSGVDYLLSLELLPAGGSISLSGSGIANEGEWDDGLPLRMDNYDGFGGYYPLDLGFNMYWDDNPEKMARFTRILDQSDYVVITSSRQWGSLPRMPERFPMTSLYYRNLIGCPLTMVIEDCYRVAQPGMFQGGLGFELIQVFESPPRLGGLRLNDQYAEEAFTVYDHPKVLIFKKTQNYNSQQVHTLLATVDFSHIIRKAPMRYKMRPEDLLLPDYRWAEQRLGGTWSELFNTNNLQNRFPALSVVLWYISVALLGLITYPLLRFALPGLADGAYPLARTAGMLILSYIVWIAGSLRIPFSRPTISAALVLMLLLGCFLAYRQREELRQLWRSHRRYFLIVEGLTLAFFLFDLFIRYGNPDLWHPWKGGEKPMDFSYFNAVLKSTSFPPYDPWYAGGYLNYYYYGFVIVGVLVKWLGIVPSVAYNLILPTLFSMIAMGAFSVVWNLVASRKRSSRGEAGADPQDSQSATASTGVTLSTILPSIGAALGMAVLGNLGTVRMIFQGYQKLVAPEGVIENASLLTHWVWAARGFIQVIQGARLPYGIGDWYWIPSRAIPAPGDVEPITEFPFFTVLYADLHAHLIALPITLLALACIISILLSQARWKSWLSALSGFVLAGLAIGALRPTNTWDFYPYLILSLVVVGYTLWMNLPQVEKIPQVMTKIISTSWLRLLVTLGGMALLAGLAFVLYQPYSHWYALGYDKVDLWKGTHTPLSSYLTHWGLFLFLIVSWMAWETIDWMAKTPISSLRKLQPYRNLILVCVALLLILIVGQLGLGLYIAWFLPGGDVPSRLSQLAVPISGFALPLAAWAGILLLRPRQPDAKRFVLFLVGTGLVLTFTVEVIVLRGDIGRMNTVFKFYLQVWTFFAVSTAAALGWLLPLLPAWSPSWRKAWQIALGVLVACAALYTLMATMAKIEDRMSDTAPHTLDGIAFINYSTYNDQWGAMDLSQDYRAILWMQENVYGSPVIVEANLRQLYRWGSRYTIYTGLPGVVGWEWHQQQQRAVVPATWVTDRIMEIADFYTTTDWQLAQAFLRKYQVSYIIVGQQERGMYPGPGLDKFPAANGVLWSEVYRDGNTVIYQVEGP
jgi:YYY domain-containing protein